MLFQGQRAAAERRVLGGCAKAISYLKTKTKVWPWICLAGIVVYNPLIRIHLKHNNWGVVNLATIAMLLVSSIVRGLRTRKYDDYEKRITTERA